MIAVLKEEAQNAASEQAVLAYRWLLDSLDPSGH
jgi:hypothetical protein